MIKNFCLLKRFFSRNANRRDEVEPKNVILIKNFSLLMTFFLKNINTTNGDDPKNCTLKVAEVFNQNKFYELRIS